jgi:hypothetical protein
MVFKKNAKFLPKLAKIAKNSNPNIDPWPPRPWCMYTHVHIHTFYIRRQGVLDNVDRKDVRQTETDFYSNQLVLGTHLKLTRHEFELST